MPGTKKSGLNKPIEFRTTFRTYAATAVIGEGGAGRVYRATDEDGNSVAIKALDPSKTTRDHRKRFQNELSFCERNKHPNILTVLDHGIAELSGEVSPFYVMPLYPKSLRNLLNGEISAIDLPKYFRQLLDGLEAAHLKHVIHRDVKPENVLCDPEQRVLVLADFGIARFTEETLFTSIKTLPHSRLANFRYAAPEQRSPGRKVDARADIYAAGLIVNEMATGDIPQGTKYKLIGEVFPELEYLDPIVEKMIRQDPEGRYGSIEDLKQDLIRQGQDFIIRQRLRELDETVIPTTELDDPLISHPPRLVDADWDKGLLTLTLSREVNPTWIWALQNIGSFTSLYGKPPTSFNFSGNLARVNVKAAEVQPAIDYFKEWLPRANQRYEMKIKADKEADELKLRQQLASEKLAEEQRLSVMKSIRI